MKELKCPKCGTMFTIDEADYAVILSQVRSKEFENEVDKRVAEIKKHFEETHELETDNSIRKAVDENRKSYEEQIDELKNLLEKTKEENRKTLDAIKEESRKKEEELKEEIQNEKNSKVALSARIDNANVEKEKAVLEAESKLKKEYEDKLEEKRGEIEKQKEIYENKLEEQKAEGDRKLKEAEIEKNKLEISLQKEKESVEYYKDLKTRMSTKMIGETLEQHCENSFNQIRMTAFPNAEFDKDNDASGGTKGDYIYREKDLESGVELLSIMFEMKNEADTTATKHKNEDFFAKLDKDRNDKKCEYAVLVSMLEADSDYYNAGIVDVSYRYPKMFVVRPQCFIAIIGLLRNAALGSLEYKKELVIAKNQDVDITDFESKLDEFKDKFGKNVEQAGKKFQDAIDDIDKTIKQMEKVKKDLELTIKHLNEANNKVEGVSIKKLTSNNPTMKQKFEELKQNGEK